METLTVPKDLIAEKAYELFKSRGATPGSDLDDWLAAEKELARQARQGASVPYQAKKTPAQTSEMISKSGKRSNAYA